MNIPCRLYNCTLEVVDLLPTKVTKTIPSQVLEDRKRGQGATMEERKVNHRLKILDISRTAAEEAQIENISDKKIGRRNLLARKIC